ncbi:phage minor head protein [uncultured Tissierella sp.]|uniref:phage minor head protein n=1 Tax=uncultured Tissierella sp. TaxID=448160 RepID=UPI0028038D6E|nr:phage minor head protein [uncultured Tissierella sp.]MDU5080241.1 phage minor head protein [Bacillota bacterium]
MAQNNIWEPKRRIERGYNRALKNITNQINVAIGETEDPYKMVRLLKQISNQKPYQEYCESLAMKMVTNVFNDSAKVWRQAARNSSLSRDIYHAIMEEIKNPKIRLAVVEQISNNARLISTLPSDIADFCTTYIQEESLRGKRASDIAKELISLIPDKSKARIEVIARTETSKTSTALTMARAESLGLNWYIWRTSQDARVRKSHDHMEDVLVNWKKPPSPERLVGQISVGNYHAGNIYNCRCYPEPVVSLDFIKWPHKVYYNGSIQTMTRKQFEEIA